MILRRILGLLSAALLVGSCFVSTHDMTRAIYMVLSAILMHLWSIEE